MKLKNVLAIFWLALFSQSSAGNELTNYEVPDPALELPILRPQV
ncbi:MAG: hypothetical protein ABGZ53_32285 [Fuerstiella sp.]